MRIGSWLSRIFHPHAVRPTAPASATPTPIAAQPPSSTADTFEPGAPMKVNLGQVTGFSPAERAKLDVATQRMAEVLNSREFRDAVLSATFAGKPGYASDSRSPAEVYATIRAAKESFSSSANGQVDMNLTVQNFSWFQRNIVGYTTESSDTLTTNRRFFDAFSPAEVAGHLTHEWLHKLGFEHDFKATAQRPDSVPYEIGELVEHLASGGQLTPL